MRRVLIAIPLGCALLLVAGVGYNLLKMDTEELLLCGSGQGDVFIPSGICHQYLRQFRVEEKDVRELEQAGGLDFILNIEGDKRFELATLYLSRGLDVDSVNQYGDASLTPLQAAVLYNDLERVEFLLKNGADPTVKNAEGLTALELSQRLDKSGESRERIIKLLRK